MSVCVGGKGRWYHEEGTRVSVVLLVTPIFPPSYYGEAGAWPHVSSSFGSYDLAGGGWGQHS